jgi:hypothetical protein
MPPSRAPPDWEVLKGEGVRAECKEEDLPPAHKVGGVCSEPVHGRLRAKEAQWRSLAKAGLVSAFVLSIVLSGYVIEWEGSAPAPSFATNHPSVFENANFVRSAINAALSSGAVARVCRSKLRCIMPLGVAGDANSKLRLIYDARYVNSYVRYQKFKMEELHKQGRHIFAGQRFGSVLDIASAFHHVEVNAAFWEFLGFEF